MNHPDLFASLAYPAVPGARANLNSRAAAEAMKPRAPSIKMQVLGLLCDASMTADRAAGLLGRDKLGVRPRFSELLAEGYIYDTGRSGTNTSNLKATIWTATEAGRAFFQQRRAA
jgi:hypothetical protein